jgi:hypothetical protein
MAGSFDGVPVTIIMSPTLSAVRLTPMVSNWNAARQMAV